MKRKPNLNYLYRLTVLILALLFIYSCKKPLLRYNITIKSDYHTLVSGGHHIINKITRLSVTDDTEAYEKGLIDYYTMLSVEQTMPDDGLHSKSFTVTDSRGMDVSLRLSKKTKDSLAVKIKRLTDKISKQMTHK